MDFSSDQIEDSIQHSNRSIESFESLDWDGLLEVCKEKEEQLNLAGTYGLKIYEELLDAQAHADDLRIQHEKEIDKYIQESHDLKIKLDLNEKSIQSQHQEFESYQKQSATKKEAEIEELSNKWKREISAIKKEKDSLLSDLEQSQLREKHAVEKIERQEERIQAFQSELQKKSAPIQSTEINLSEVFELQEKICLLEEQREARNGEIQELENRNQELMLELRSKAAEIENLSKDIEEAEMRSTSYFNHLQQAREEANEVKAELELLKADLRSSGHSKMGNSLFGEVEDKRVEMEKRLLSMQVKYESLQKAYTFVKSQLHNMKTQIVALLQMNSGRADSERISHLERALSQAKAETLALTKNMKESKNQTLSTDKVEAYAKTLPHFESNKDMVRFLSIQIDDYKSKLDVLREELDQTYMVKLAESDKLQTAETKLHETGVLAEKFKNENMQLRLRLEETKSKLQAETQKRILVEKKFSYDSTGDVIPEGILSDEKMREKKPLPYTLAKAKEKSVEKNKLLQNKQNNKSNGVKFSSAMNWSLLPREILKELNIDKTKHERSDPEVETHDELIASSEITSKNKEYSENSNHEVKRFCQDRKTKSRKVSFKDEPETIVAGNPDQSTINEDTENKTSNSYETSKSREDLVLADEKLSQYPESFSSSPVTVSSNSSTPKTRTANDDECKVQ